VVLETEGRCFVNRKEVRQGDYISLDGRKGLIYIGKHEILAEGEPFSGLK
jgi:hypothetical protein